MLYNEGHSFIESQNEFGANALLSFGLAVNESGWGRSSIAINKNNILGMVPMIIIQDLMLNHMLRLRVVSIIILIIGFLHGIYIQMIGVILDLILGINLVV